MTDIEICESIIKAGTCGTLKSLQCDDCPLNKHGEFDCEYYNENATEPSLQAAKDYLAKHNKKEKKILTKEEAILAIINGKKVTNTIYKGHLYIYWDNGCFMAYSGITRRCDINVEPDGGWYIYEEPKVKKWQWAYKSKNKFCLQETKPTGEVTKHLTEEEAKELYGEDIIKLPFTEIEE